MDPPNKDGLSRNSIMLASAPSTNLYGCESKRPVGKASHEGSSNDSSPTNNVRMRAARVR